MSRLWGPPHCGANEFRQALRERGTKVADDLATVDLDALEASPDWFNGVRLALDELQNPELKDRVFTAWLPQMDRHVRVADFVLLYCVRRGALFAPMSIELLRQWIAKCVDLASRTGDESLVESLIITLGHRYNEYPELAAVVGRLARVSRLVSVALRRQAFGTLDRV